MSAMWSLLGPLLCLLRHVSANNDNYMDQSGSFASISNMEDMLFPESEIMKKLQVYHDRMETSLDALKRYIDAWHSLDLESTVEDSALSRHIYLEDKRLATQKKGADLMQRLNAFRKVDNSKKGDVALFIDGKEEENHDRERRLEMQKKIEKEIEDNQDEYERWTEQQANNNSSSLAKMKKRPVRESGGVQHPIDAYLFTKRMTYDWFNVRNSMIQLCNDTTTLLDEIDAERDKYYLPVTADLHGAAVAIVRLQDLYNLDMMELGSGVIPKTFTFNNKDAQSLGKLRTWDYILLGKQAFKLGYNMRAIQWFKMAVKVSETELLQGDEGDIIPLLRTTILKHEANGTEVEKKMKKKMKKEERKFTPRLKQFLSPSEEEEHQTRLCRGETFISAEQEAALHCRLDTRQSAYLLLMPLKLEELHHSPRVVLFRDFLTKPQTDYVIKKAKPELLPSVHGTGDNSYGSSMIRVSMTGWLKESLYAKDRMARITKKIEEATGMDASSPLAAEAYQVANYGIGGLYNVHTDYGVNTDEVMGDRLATFLIYLSDVTAGGWTAFTRLGIKVKPERGTALFWYNLHRNGNHDPNTHHAACPVLHGSKWITTKWIHYNSQFLKHRCGLNRKDLFDTA